MLRKVTAQSVFSFHPTAYGVNLQELEAAQTLTQAGHAVRSEGNRQGGAQEGDEACA